MSKATSVRVLVMCCAVFAVVTVVNGGVAPEASPAPFIKQTDCGDICSRAFCVAKKREECDSKTQVFVPRDGDCYCCDVCIPKVVTTSEVLIDKPIVKKTDCGDFCSRVRCAQQKQEDCNESTEVFMPRDGDCYCCDRCIPKVETPASIDKKCKPTDCATIKCYDVPSKVCFDKGLAFAPKDECSCCDGCV